ncbi:MAG: hypothetical protein KVP17_000935 [Porospora cf. gigantea B]|uniref:uncharacterized protein n=1 Tax=Porospora cf. gigantea B TaxID=2853592 RepID=UPI0035719EC9|nr:MAG: hypothetical protein KVP17_000935 [Porospora cf. gigantea B]
MRVILQSTQISLYLGSALVFSETTGTDTAPKPQTLPNCLARIPRRSVVAFRSRSSVAHAALWTGLFLELLAFSSAEPESLERMTAALFTVFGGDVALLMEPLAKCVQLGLEACLRQVECDRDAMADERQCIVAKSADLKLRLCQLPGEPSVDILGKGQFQHLNSSDLLTLRCATPVGVSDCVARVDLGPPRPVFAVRRLPECATEPAVTTTVASLLNATQGHHWAFVVLMVLLVGIGCLTLNDGYSKLSPSCCVLRTGKTD